jgi:hypothetical protein
MIFRQIQHYHATGIATLLKQNIYRFSGVLCRRMYSAAMKKEAFLLLGQRR